MAGVSNLFGTSQVLDKKGNKVDLAEHCAGKTVGIYFSAHWCGPCRGFTPVLADFYNKYSKSKNFEIIFVSSDRDENQFNEYYNEMPWLSLAYSDRAKKQTLSQNFNVEGIPTLVLINGDSGDVLTLDASVCFDEDPQGDNFPWTQ